MVFDVVCLSNIRINIAREREAEGCLSFLVSCVSDVKSTANDVGEGGRPRGNGAKRERVVAGTVAQRGYVICGECLLNMDERFLKPCCTIPGTGVLVVRRVGALVLVSRSMVAGEVLVGIDMDVLFEYVLCVVLLL